MRYACTLALTIFFGSAGFLVYMYTLTVPIYYVSLILQALMGVRHSFEEEKYAHIEKWIHAAAYVIPGACAAVLAATENFNPAPAMCWDKKAPLGCESNAEMECVRGQDVGHFGWILAVFMLLLYFVFPLLVATSMYCWVNKSQENMRVVSQGFREMRERAKKQMMESIAKQICVYLFLFWIIWLFSTIEFIHWSLTGEYLYNIMILGYVMYSAQGVIFAVVYFSLQKIGRVRSTLIVGSRGNNTVENLKASIEGRGNASQTNDDIISETMDYNIFDGTADEDSPWARFIDPDSSEDEVDEQACEEEARES